MGRLNEIREAEMREACRGRGMVHANLLFELFEEIRQLKEERNMLSQLLFRREKYWFKVHGPIESEFKGPIAIASP